MRPRARTDAPTIPVNPTTEPPLVIAIDGPAGAGKSTVARAVARRLGIPYLDTGAMYRAVGLLALREGLSLPLGDDDGARLADLVDRHRIDVDAGPEGTAVRVDGVDVGDAIRSPECSQMASAVSAVATVRRRMVELQREIGHREGGVLEGRDIGTVVFPDARLKVFLTATPGERARRRQEQLHDAGVEASLEEVRAEQLERDRRDTTRRESPLRVAPGAVVVDSTGRSVEEVVERIVRELERPPGGSLDSSGRSAVRSRNHGS